MNRKNLKKLQKKYREPIVIEKRAKSIQNSNGVWTKGKWEIFRKVFANIKNLYGQEYFVAGQTNEQSTVKFFIRFMPGITNETKSDYRIKHRGKIYNIYFVDNICFEDSELEIKAIERDMTDGAI